MISTAMARGSRPAAAMAAGSRTDRPSIHSLVSRSGPCGSSRYAAPGIVPRHGCAHTARMPPPLPCADPAPAQRSAKVSHHRDQPQAARFRRQAFGNAGKQRQCFQIAGRNPRGTCGPRTLTATLTGGVSLVWARCTWAMDAAASGAPKLENRLPPAYQRHPRFRHAPDFPKKAAAGPADVPERAPSPPRQCRAGRQHLAKFDVSGPSFQRTGSDARRHRRGLRGTPAPAPPAGKRHGEAEKNWRRRPSKNARPNAWRRSRRDRLRTFTWPRPASAIMLGEFCLGREAADAFSEIAVQLFVLRQPGHRSWASA